MTALTYLGLVAIPQRRLFAVTTALISLLAAGLAAQAVLFLQQAGVLTMLSETAWDTSAILSDTSLFGRVLHTLIGYSDQPSVLQVVVYAATLAVIVVSDQDGRVAARASHQGPRRDGGLSGARSSAALFRSQVTSLASWV